MDNANYDLRNKGLHLVKTDKENFWTLMDLRVAKDQKNFVATNAVSLAQAYNNTESEIEDLDSGFVGMKRW